MSHREDCTHHTCPDVRASGVRVVLGDRTVLGDVSVLATAGRVTGLLGPNGSGKTTLLHVLAGLRRPDGGVVHVGHEKVLGLPHRQRARRIALVEQHATTSAELTVRQVVRLGRLPHRRSLLAGLADPRGEEVVERAIGQVGLRGRGDQTWGTLSGGERQRAHLARALAQEPEVLLLDEPTNHLDLGQQVRFMSLVRSLGLTTVAALHDLEMAAAYCDEVLVLQDGRVRGAGTVAAALTDDLLADVYAVRASVEQHPRLQRRHLVWDGHVEETA